MSWSYRIARVAGTDVKLHVTFLAFLAWLGWVAYLEGGAGAALGTVGFLLALFFCVLLHEFGHILMARRFDVRTPDVILLPIGGIARLERIPERPREELLVALAGPAVTLAIAAGLYLTALAQGHRPALLPLSLEAPPVVRLCQFNVLLLLFNLLPAFPMDGGRVLRALLAMRMGLPRATRSAAAIGQFLAFAMGFYAIFSQSWLLAVIAFFIFLGAGAEASAVQERVVGHGLGATQMMVTQFRTLPIHATLTDAVELLLAGEQREFPVLDNEGRVEGLLTRDHLIHGLSRYGPGGAVRDVMHQRPPHVAPGASFEEALGRLRASGLPALPVIDAGGRLVGLITVDNISDLLLVRRAVGQA
ncbi:MAG TPA: site-2 protease family protein [Gemmatimonadales bacterium]|nr:site-2 protease family protein [Gemmatimonadales bacterium]